MNKSLAKSMCRACLTLEGPFQSIFTFEEGSCVNISLAEMIMSSSPLVRIALNDRLPDEICSQCADIVIKSYAFKIQVEKNDTILRSQTIILDDDDDKHESITPNLGNSRGPRESRLDSGHINNESLNEDFEDNISFEEENYTSDDSTMDNDHFVLEPEIILNLEKHTEDLVPHICDVCKQAFTNFKLFNEHKCGIEGGTCEVCNEKFLTFKELSLHQRKHVKEKLDKLRTCNFCNKTFRKMKLLKNHLLVHTKKPYKCEKCKRSFTSNDNLQEHLVTHTNKKPYKCEKCPKKYALEKSLRCHLLTHKEEPDLKCCDCDKTFCWRYELIKHQTEHFKLN